MHWFTPHRIEGSLPEAIASLASVGVTFKLISKSPYYETRDEGGHRFVMKAIGELEVLDTGELRALAYEGLNGTELYTLLGAAEHALWNKPEYRDGWQRRRNGGRPRWECEVQVEADPERDDIAAVVARDLTRHERRRQAEVLDALLDTKLGVDA